MGDYWTTAVLDRTDSSWVVWHIANETECPPELSRLRGAWVLPLDDHATAAHLIRGHPLLLTEQGAEALGELGLDEARVVDPEVVLENFAAHQRRMQGVYEALRDSRPPSKRKQLVPPFLPNPSRPEDIPEVVGGDTETHRALRLARWMSQVAEQWADMDGERKVREYMIEALGKKAPELPLFP